VVTPTQEKTVAAMMSKRTERAKAVAFGKAVHGIGSKRSRKPRRLTTALGKKRAASSGHAGNALGLKDVATFIDVVQHAYLRLIAGDSVDARRTLEHGLKGRGIGEIAAEVSNAAHLTRGETGTPVVTHSSNKPSRALCEPGAARVVVRTLGTFEVVVDGEHPGSPRKPAYRPLGILKVLIAHGGCAVSEGLLVDALWPDLDGDHAHDARQIALHRLRRLLGSTETISVNDGRMSIDDEQVWVDAFALETLCRNPLFGRTLERAELALDLYKGVFLPAEIDAQWSIHMRECLRAKFVSLVAKAATELEVQNNFVGAASLFERGLAVDDMENVLRDGLVRCLNKTGSARSRRKKKKSTD
jgi:DNA-binding SARP family transcriptional activator